METLKKICSHLEDCVLGELGKDKSQVDAKELGEVMDAIKDAKMAMYYASIVEAMEESEKGVTPISSKFYTRGRRDARGRYMYTEPMMDDEMMNADYPKEGTAYYSENSSKEGTPYYGGAQVNRHYYTNPRMMKHWYEHKDMGDESKKLQGLEKDLKDLSEEVTEMVGEMSNAEKQMLRTKMQNIIQKI